MFGAKDDENFLKISNGTDKCNDSKTPSSANSTSNETDHKHPFCNDDECKGDKAINKNDVVNTDVNVDKNAQIDHANTDSLKGTEASSDNEMIYSRTESNEISDSVTSEEAEKIVNSSDESAICGSKKMSPLISERIINCSCLNFQALFQ